MAVGGDMSSGTSSKAIMSIFGGMGSSIKLKGIVSDGTIVNGDIGFEVDSSNHLILKCSNSSGMALIIYY